MNEGAIRSSKEEMRVVSIDRNNEQLPVVILSQAVNPSFAHLLRRQMSAPLYLHLWLAPAIIFIMAVRCGMRLAL